MAKRKKRIDNNQTSFDFERSIQQYRTLKEELLNTAPPAKPDKYVESWNEALIEIAAAVKRAHRHSGLSREQLVDGINEYFGGVVIGGKPLSLHMLNHYLSKPVQYPMPAALIFAIQHVLSTLDIAGLYAEAEGGRVISREEIRELAVGKLDDAILEMQRLKKQFRGMKS